MTIEQGEQLGIMCFGLVISVIAYGWPQLAHSEQQLKVFRFTGPLLVLCGGLVLIRTLVR